MTPSVTVGIPAFNASRFLEETVNSVVAQTWPNLEVAISVDKSDDDTAAVARRLSARFGIPVSEQPTRIGWVANSNHVLKSAGTGYAMIMPHDDLLEPTYVERCVTALLANPDAVVACSDIATFPEHGAVRQLEFKGDRISRLAKMIADGFAAVAYRGVLRMDRLQGRFVPRNAGDDFAADTLWMARMCIAGEVIRVPETLYRKRVHPASAHHAWRRRAPGEEDRRWLAHAAELEEVIRLDAPHLLKAPEIASALRVRACRRGGAYFERHTPIGGLAGRFPMARARFELASQRLAQWLTISREP